MPSTRNSIEAHVHLLDALDCSNFFVPEGPAHVLETVKQIALRRPLTTFQVGSLASLLEDENVAHYAYTKAFDTARDEPFVAVHTSGSTGMPKPIVLTHRFATALDSMLKIPLIGAKPTHFHYWQGLRCFMPFPLFHSGGLSGLIMSIYARMKFIFPPPGPLTSHMVDDVLGSTDVQLTILPSAILTEISQEPQYMEKLAKVPYVYFGASPIPPSVGARITSKSRLLAGFGSTEVGTFPVEMHNSQDWQYLKFSPYLGYEMRHYHDGLYEMYIVRDPELEDFQCVFSTFPDLSVYRTKDLFSKHPTKDDLWLPRGRSDDIVVYSTGEKVNPTSFEGTLNGHPEVSSTLMYGEGQFQSTLLVEPKRTATTEAEERRLMSTLWPLIEEANSVCPGYAKVTREMILFTTPDKPLPRAPKGTVQRKAAYELYRPRLEELYRSQNAVMPTLSSGGPYSGQSQALQQMLLDIISSFQGFENVDMQTRLFDSGLDSLQVLTLICRVKKGLVQLGISPNAISSKVVYASPTISTLAFNLLSAGNTRERSASKMQDLYERHISELPLTARDAKRHMGRHNVILTGSTGSLGSYLLDQLLLDESIETIYCLNRRYDGESYQRTSMAAKGLSPTFEAKRVKFFQADFSKPYLGLFIANYTDLLRTATVIIHNAWTVDFNQSLEHLSTTHIRGVKQFIDFSSRSAHGAFLFFISSGSTVTNSKPHNPKVPTEAPEQISEDWDSAEAIGYSRAKLISERIIATAATHANVPAAICRLGQIAGPTKTAGQWPKQEWLPSILTSSKIIGKLPSTLGALERIDWVPVDVVASTVLDLVRSSLYYSPPGQATVYHVVSPRKTSWSELLPTVKEHLSLEAVPSAEWMELLRASSEEGRYGLECIPALKLMDFIEDVFSTSNQKSTCLPLSIEKTVKACPALANLEAINGGLMKLWMEQWHF